MAEATRATKTTVAGEFVTRAVPAVKSWPFVTDPKRVSPARRVGSVIAWFVAPMLIAAAPVVYFDAGASDSATEGFRIAAAAVPLAIAWLALLIGLSARRAAGLVGFAALMLIVARALGNASTIYGDRAWVSYWAICVVAWVAVSRFARRTPG